LAAVISSSATETDALSTALLTLGRAHVRSLADLRPGMRTLLAFEADSGLGVEASGIAIGRRGDQE
jgi:thiamine biosynthesis lipoprotein ApbE